MPLTFVSGPCRSGKSKWAENLVGNANQVLYVATSRFDPNDPEWTDRIHKHKIRRPKKWSLIESADLSSILTNVKYNFCTIIIDSLGGFVTEHISYSNENWNKVELELIKTIKAYKGILIIVGEEVGWGLISHNKIGNLFRDRIGSISHKLNHISSDSWLVINGRAININELGLLVK